MKIALIYFSPTHTTRKILEQIAKGFTEGTPDAEIEHIDFTKPATRAQQPEFKANLCIAGAPCYEARIPPIARQAFRMLQGNNIPTIAVILYGNRTLGLALKQFVGILDQQHFRVMATGTFIGEHSYAGPDLPLALNRPDSTDLDAAFQFGKDLKTKGIPQDHITTNDVPGKIDFFFRLLPEGFMGSFGSPSDLDPAKCTQCGLCARNCPTVSINTTSLKINRKTCIRCMSCVKSCVPGARHVQFRLKGAVQRFMKDAMATRKEPKYFIGKKK